MDFEAWAPYYREILREMGFSEKEDEASADLISRAENAMPLDKALCALRERIGGRPVVVCGNADCLIEDIRRLWPQIPGENNAGGRIVRETVIAADGAAVVLAAAGIFPDIIVTDLDGKGADDPEKEVWMANGRPSLLILVHAHGDNKEALEKYLPACRAFIATCQCRPPEESCVLNAGGFTDGDRCVFLADAFGASDIRFAGFDLEDDGVTPLKKKKLKWAGKLIGELRRQNPNIRAFGQ